MSDSLNHSFYLAEPKGVEPSPTVRQTVILTVIRRLHMAGPARFELATSVLETLMITVSPRSYYCGSFLF